MSQFQPISSQFQPETSRFGEADLSHSLQANSASRADAGCNLIDMPEFEKIKAREGVAQNRHVCFTNSFKSGH
jgi:hypothetical protein